ncbi:hypothetical protein PCASD_22954 [Puccinia coronata f. sp. avenae]|uniref:Uncharacterized protein n=1 Tax=Puccinia coronata f. sp. avenae TaxID=200324 RepID=A0A2N5U095_9BASI|nr:hypothetical protein PCASD_22954 [Puccinia coronata f. sp. avenae]
MHITISPRHLLSLLTCLAIYIAHSSHSLPTSTHVIHKRMEIVNEAVEGVRTATLARGNEFSSAKGLEVANSLENPEKLRLPPNPMLKHEEIFRGKVPTQPIWKQTLTSPSGLWTWIRQRFPSLSKMIQRIRAIFASNRPAIQTVQRPFSPVFAQQPDLLQLIGQDESVDTKVQTFIEYSLTHNPELVSKIKQEVNLEAPLHLRTKLTESFKNLHGIMVQGHKDQMIMKPLDDHILNRIQNIFLDGKHIPDSFEAFGAFAKKMGAYKSQSLVRDREILRKVIPNRKQKYLFRFLGFLGPGNVLSPQIRAAFVEKLASTALVLNKDRGGKDFVENLELIQAGLADLARLYRENPDPLKTYPHIAKEHEVAVKFIAKHEAKLVSVFGSRDELKRALDTIEDMDFYKGFMLELKDPRSLGGFELQLLEPWGYLHGYYDIENRDVIYQLFGIEKDYTSLKTIEEMGDHALENIQKTLQYFREAREEEKKIMNILSPEGLQNLVDFLKEGKVFSIGDLLELPMA